MFTSGLLTRNSFHKSRNLIEYTRSPRTSSTSMRVIGYSQPLVAAAHIVQCDEQKMCEHSFTHVKWIVQRDHRSRQKRKAVWFAAEQASGGDRVGDILCAVLRSMSTTRMKLITAPIAVENGKISERCRVARQSP